MSADLNTAIYAWLKTVGAVTALIGSSDSMRAWPVEVLDTKQLPYIVWEAEKDSEDQVHNGPAQTAHSRVLFACHAVDIPGASALADALSTAIRNFRRGTMGAVTINWLLYKSSSPSYEWQQQDFVVDVESEFWYVL